MSLLVVGSIALDSVETPFGLREEVLGGSATYFSIAAAFFAPVGLVAAVGEDFPDAHVRFLASRGVDVGGLARRAGQTFRWRGRYGEDLDTAHTLDTRLGVFANFRPELPAELREAEHVFLGNIDPEIQAQVLDQVRAPGLVACDTMNYWIEHKRAALARVLRRVDLLFVNEAEARQLAGERNVIAAARRILTLGPGAVIVKRGEHGAVLFSGQGCFSVPAFPVEALADPTGAGDSFAGGLMGYLASCRSRAMPALRRGVVFGSVLASFAVELFSVERLASLTRAEVDARYAALRALTQFDDLHEGEAA